ncbi:unnamed protein product, partial [Laminaria digitata]
MSRGADYPVRTYLSRPYCLGRTLIPFAPGSASRRSVAPLPFESPPSIPREARTTAGAEGQTPHFPPASSVATVQKANLCGTVHPFGSNRQKKPQQADSVWFTPPVS